MNKTFIALLSGTKKGETHNLEVRVEAPDSSQAIKAIQEHDWDEHWMSGRTIRIIQLAEPDDMTTIRVKRSRSRKRRRRS